MAKKRINSKKKGSSVERQVAKLMSAWWGEEFSRSPSSGMFATTHATALSSLGVDIAGDLICPSDFPFNVEVKARKSIDLFDAARNGKQSEIWGWWEQSVRDANQTKKFPLVIFKENNKQFYCMIDDILPLHKRHNSLIFIEDRLSSRANDSFCIIPLVSLTNVTKEELLNNIQQLQKFNTNEVNGKREDVYLPPDI